MPRYGPGPVPTTPDISQLERWLRGEFEAVRGSTDDTYTLSDFLLENYVIAGYGSISRDTPVALSNIGPAWQIITFTTEDIAQPRGLVYNLPNGFTVTTTGIWYVSITLNLSFDELNAGRVLQVRLYNATDASGASPIDYYVGRNTAGITLTLGFNALIDTGVVMGLAGIAADKAIQVEISSAADSFTGVSLEQALWSLHHVSEYKGGFSLDARGI